MSTLSLRLAQEKDVERIIAIDHLASAGDAQRVAHLTRSVAHHVCHVPKGHANFDGYIVVRPTHFFGRDFIELVQVATHARRRGLGRSLLQAVMQLEGTRQVFTSTNRSNEPMRMLLHQENWIFSGELEGLDDGDPEIVFFTWRP